jgi:hypothetical protein
MSQDEPPPRRQHYLGDGARPEPVPERVPDPYFRSTIFIMLEDEPAIAEQLAADGWEWDGPPPVRKWCASDQGEFGILAEFEGSREDAIAWALARPDVAEIYLFSEETQDVHLLDRPGP